jgi:hypothetical protein
MFGSDVLLTRPVNAEPFVEQYTHTLTGVTGTIELSLDYDWSACSIPASWNYNTPTDSGTDGWGALQFIDSLDQNGVYVSLLNDEEAPGNSYYYGTDSLGVKGWHQLIDNVGITCEDLPECATIISIVDDIAALQSDKVDKVAGKGLSTEDYTTAEKSKLAGIEAGAEVNVNADWNAVSGDAQILNKPTIPSIAGLVPETRTITINGTTQDLSANRTFTIATGLTVGSTAITSGTVGRVLFEGTSNVLQESANFFWDNTNARLGIGTALPLAKIDSTGTIRATGVSTISSGFGIELSYESTVGNIYVFNRATFAFGSLNLNDRARIFSTGNFAIGTTTDAGFRLDVNGTGRFSGLLTLKGTTNNDTTSILRLEQQNGNGRFLVSAAAQVLIAGESFQQTENMVRIDRNFNPSGGSTATHTTLLIATTINQTTGANGITRGLYVNPTLTAAADFRAIENTAGKVCLNTSSGNTMIGTTTDAGFKLDVNGTARITGTGTTGTTFGLTVRNSSGTLGLTVRDDGTVYNRFMNTTQLSQDGAGNAGYIQGNFCIGAVAYAGASAVLDLRSTTRGFLPPRMTNAQRLAIASPAVGLIVYCTDAVEGLYVNKSTGWTFVI